MDEVFLERMTWPDVEARIAGGARRAVICAASMVSYARAISHPHVSSTSLILHNAIGVPTLIGAIVYLKNVRTLTVKTYISDDSGQYRFSGLDPNVDYEMHAEHDDQTSANHTVSSFDSRKDIVVSLKVDKAKKKDER